MDQIQFEWDAQKDSENRKKHRLSFFVAQCAFLDPRRILAKDLNHSRNEQRYFCIGKITSGIITVRFTYREKTIRIIGAGYWRKGKQLYEKENKLY